jgi:hypothetical protein
MSVSLQFDNQLERLIEARHDELSRHVASCVVTQQLLDCKLFTHADFPRTLMAVRAHRQRLVIAIGRLKQDGRGVVHTTLPAADVRQHRIAEDDRRDARIRRNGEHRPAHASASRYHHALIEQVRAPGTPVVRTYLRARGVTRERVLEMAP